MTLATYLTLSRIVLLPVWLLLLQPAPVAAAALFAGLMLTDFLDGHLARRRGEVTVTGAILDPVADKTVVLIGSAAMLGLGLLPAWYVALAWTRNVAQLLAIPLLVWWLRIPFHVRPKVHPKVATALGFLAVFLPSLPLDEVSSRALSSTLTWGLLPASAVLELWVLVTYVPRLVQIATRRHDTFE